MKICTTDDWSQGYWLKAQPWSQVVLAFKITNKSLKHHNLVGDISNLLCNFLHSLLLRVTKLYSIWYKIVRTVLELSLLCENSFFLAKVMQNDGNPYTNCMQSWRLFCSWPTANTQSFCTALAAYVQLKNWWFSLQFQGWIKYVSVQWQVTFVSALP